MARKQSGRSSVCACQATFFSTSHLGEEAKSMSTRQAGDIRRVSQRKHRAEVLTRRVHETNRSCTTTGRPKRWQVRMGTQDMITERCIYYIRPAGLSDVEAETEKIADFLAMYQTSRQEQCVKTEGSLSAATFAPTCTKAQTLF